MHGHCRSTGDVGEFENAICTWECSPRDALPTEEVLVTGGEQGGLQEVGDL